ncbi:hypothetical protein ACN26Y_10975 [Micromonospora sp. WMMD558]|uniref:hypothetical protein n=1 Tax=unclassified Micromonospora TaxID=2617518 RepID=UPI0012B4C669|nr:hypothetical protein [Micromonospora sp. WMMC415]QGN46771.1 hypothetical protein GKC29_07870 [Micromonospora sp. WMMC415]
MTDIEQRISETLRERATGEVDVASLTANAVARGHARRARRRAAAGVGLAVAALGTTLVAGLRPDRSPGVPATTPPATPAVAVDCGTFDLGQGEHLPVSALNCLREAVLDGRPARLAETRPTTEGDPIRKSYTTGGDEHVTVVVDTREDDFGPREVYRLVCTDPVLSVAVVMFDECTEPEVIQD